MAELIIVERMLFTILNVIVSLHATLSCCGCLQNKKSNVDSNRIFFFLMEFIGIHTNTPKQALLLLMYYFYPYIYIVSLHIYI